jgi:hypothetical protein
MRGVGDHFSQMPQRESVRFCGDDNCENIYLHSFNLKFKFDFPFMIRHIRAVNNCVGPVANRYLTASMMCQAPLLVTF